MAKARLARRQRATTLTRMVLRGLDVHVKRRAASRFADKLVVSRCPTFRDRNICEAENAHDLSRWSAARAPQRAKSELSPVA